MTEEAVPSLLSERQREVAELMAAGVLDESIARTLEVSVRTVSVEVAEILRAVGASSRFQAGIRYGSRLHAERAGR